MFLVIFLIAFFNYNSSNMMSVEISLAFSYFYSGNLEPALRCFYKIEKEDNKLFDDTYKITTYIFEIIFNDAVAEYAKRDSLIQKLISLLDQLPSLMDMKQGDWNNQGICDCSLYGLTAEDYFRT